MTTVICKKPLEEGGRTYQPGETVALSHPTAAMLASMDIVELLQDRTPGMRDKMVYAQAIRHRDA